MKPTEETKEQFMERYGKKYKEATGRDIFDDHKVALPCDCEDGGGPTHWAAISKKDPMLIQHHLDFHAPLGTPWPDCVPKCKDESA